MLRCGTYQRHNRPFYVRAFAHKTTQQSELWQNNVAKRIMTAANDPYVATILCENFCSAFTFSDCSLLQWKIHAYFIWISLLCLNFLLLVLYYGIWINVFLRKIPILSNEYYIGMKQAYWLRCFCFLRISIALNVLLSHALSMLYFLAKKCWNTSVQNFTSIWSKSFLLKAVAKGIKKHRSKGKSYNHSLLQF